MGGSGVGGGVEEGELPAPLREGTGGAFGTAGGAGVAAVEDEPVVGSGPKFRRDVPLKVLLNGKGGGAIREPQPVRNPETLGVYGYYRFVINH